MASSKELAPEFLADISQYKEQFHICRKDVEDKIKFLFGKTDDMIEDERIKEITQKLFMPKKMMNRPELVAEELERRENEQKNENLHIKYSKSSSMWKEMCAIVCNKSSAVFFDWLTTKLYEKKETDREDRRRELEAFAKEEMLKNPSSANAMHKLRHLSAEDYESESSCERTNRNHKYAS